MLPRKGGLRGRSDASTDFVSNLLSDRLGSLTPYYVTRPALARLRSLAWASWTSPDFNFVSN